MIIPVRCFTCGKVLGNKWMKYQEKLKELEKDEGREPDEKQANLVANFDQKLRGKILDELNIERICCRRHMLSHTDIIEII